MEPQKNSQPWTQNGLVLGDFVISPRSCYRIRIFCVRFNVTKVKVVALSSCGAIRRAEVDYLGGYEAVVVAPLLQHTTQNERVCHSC